MRILLWDRAPTGHRPVWLRMLARSAPPAWTVVGPESAGTDIERIAYDGGADERDALAATLARARCDAVVVGDLDPFVRRRWWRPVADARVVALDHRCTFVRPRWEGVGVGEARPTARWVRSRARYEALVRADRRLQLVCLHPRAATAGSAALRRRVVTMANPVNPFPKVDVVGWPRAGRRVVLLGSLQPRKGLDVLVDAIELLTPSERTDLHLVVAGPPSSAYRPVAEGLLERAARSVTVTALLRPLTDEEFGAALVTADVVVLPYRRHNAGSGILAQAASLAPPPNLVVSDDGWMGEQGRELGGIVFRSGDRLALAAALRAAARSPRPAAPASPPPSAQEALRPLWRCLQAALRPAAASTAPARAERNTG